MASGGRTSRYYSQNYSLVDNPANPQAAPPVSSVGDEDYQDYSNYQKSNPNHDDFDLPPRNPRSRRPQRGGWSTRKKIVVFGGVGLLVLIIIIAVAVGVTVSKNSNPGPYTYEAVNGDLKVTNSTAFSEGGGSNNVQNLDDGIGAGKDEYIYYSGDSSNFPKSSEWISFNSMWAGNLHNMRTSCKINKAGKNNSPEDIQAIYAAIQARAAASYVDHRFILAVIMQESAGCVRVGETESNGHLTIVTNPGLMQSHNGTAYNSKHVNESIFDMVQDGVQGTAHGEGLVQNLNLYGNAYRAARGYNSGYIPDSGNLSEKAGATACYVSDIANRLTGWANATSTCPHE